MRTPSAVSCSSTTVPRSWTRPVNPRSPLPQAGGAEVVVADLLAVQRRRLDGVVERLDPPPLDGVARGGPAEQHGREEQADLVDLAGVEERARQPRAALEQDRRV